MRSADDDDACVALLPSVAAAVAAAVASSGPIGGMKMFSVSDDSELLVRRPDILAVAVAEALVVSLPAIGCGCGGECGRMWWAGSSAGASAAGGGRDGGELVVASAIAASG